MSVAAEHARVAARGGGAAIAVANVDVTYGVGGAEPVKALSGINLEVPDGAFVSLVGPSGCGKSTLLKVVADLMAPTRGTVTVGGTPPRNLRHAGRIGLVFQQANLMPWLKVADNIACCAIWWRGAAAQRARRLPSIDELIQRGRPRRVSRRSIRTSFPAACSSASRSRARWRSIRPCC